MNIAFDIGNVLFHVDMEQFYKKLVYWDCVDSVNEAHKLSVELEKLSYLGTDTVGAFFNRKFSYISPDIFLKEWNKIITPNEIMLDLIYRLCKDGHSVALLSNIGTEHATFLREKFPDLMNSTINHLSCEVGSYKPQKLFFQSFLMQHSGYHTWRFFDDRPENIKAAKALGFNAVLFNLNDFTTDEQLKEYIKREII